MYIDRFIAFFSALAIMLAVTAAKKYTKSLMKGKSAL